MNSGSLGRIYPEIGSGDTLHDMTYPGFFHRLVLMGTLYQDTFNTSLSIIPSGIGDFGASVEVTPTLLADVAADVGAWWNNATAGAGSGAIQSARLTGIKLNRINAAGKYQDATTYEHTYTSPIAGINSAVIAPQLAVVATLRTAIPRGRASKGRMYLPPTQAIGTLVAGDGRSSAAQALTQANGVKALIVALNATYASEGGGIVGVASDAGTGAFQAVTEVSVGRVPDTIRSRRNKQDEDYQTVSI